MTIVYMYWRMLSMMSIKYFRTEFLLHVLARTHTHARTARQRRTANRIALRKRKWLNEANAKMSLILTRSLCFACTDSVSGGRHRCSMPRGGRRCLQSVDIIAVTDTSNSDVICQRGRCNDVTECSACTAAAADERQFPPLWASVPHPLQWLRYA